MVTIDPVLIALVVGLGAPLLTFISMYVGARLTRQSNKEANDIARFKALTDHMERRLEAAEGRIGELERNDRQKTIALDARGRYITKLLRIIASHLPELASELIQPDPEDAPYITGVLNTDGDEGKVE